MDPLRKAITGFCLCVVLGAALLGPFAFNIIPSIGWRVFAGTLAGVGIGFMAIPRHVFGSLTQLARLAAFGAAAFLSLSMIVAGYAGDRLGSDVLLLAFGVGFVVYCALVSDL